MELTRVSVICILGPMPAKRTDDDDYSYLLGEVRAELARRGMPGRDLGRLCGISQPGISRRLNNAQPFDVPELLAVCRALELSLRDLLEEAAKRRMAPVPAMRDGGQSTVVAGARFELATSGSRARQTSRRGRPVTAGATSSAGPGFPGQRTVRIPSWRSFAGDTAGACRLSQSPGGQGRGSGTGHPRACAHGRHHRPLLGTAPAAGYGGSGPLHPRPRRGSTSLARMRAGHCENTHR